MQLIVIGRPTQETGFSFMEMINHLCEQYDCVYKPCVSIVGIGPGNRNAMTKEVCHQIENADCLIGAKRMLEAVSVDGKAVVEEISPDKIAEFILFNREYGNFTVLMSGDSNFYSGTKKLLPLLKGCETKVLPGVSSLTVLCSKLHISYEDIAVKSLHGRNDTIISDIRSNQRTFVMTGGENGVNELCSTLMASNLGHLTLTVGERLSYPNEKITTGTAEELSKGLYDSLSVVLVENEQPDFVVTHGLPDTLFQREMREDRLVPMTKNEVRSVCLSKLQLTERSICWDIGAGTGSVAIEMALQARKGQVYAVEKNNVALKLLQKNKEQFALNRLHIVSGCAPDVCSELPAPTHVFIGGSSGKIKEIIKVSLEKNPFVRIVATAISLETIAELTSCMNDYAFTDTEVICMNVARGKKAGAYHLMNGENPVSIVTIQNGGLMR